MRRSKLNGGNLIDGINTWAVGVVCYSVGIVDWKMEGVANRDRRTRKILARMAVCTQGVMLRGCTCRERKGEED